MPYYPSRLSILRCASNVMAVAAVGLAGLSCALSGCAEPPREGAAATDIAPARRAGTAPVPRFASRLIGEPAPHQEDVAVSLLDAGREPRSLLRYAAEGGARQRMHIKSGGSSDVQIGGRLVYSQSEGANDASFEVHVVAAAADRIDCELRFEHATTTDWEKFQPGRATDMRVSLDRLADYRYRFSMDRRGFVRMPPLELPPELDVDGDRNMTWLLIEEAVRSIVMLPAEPVGIGARWRIVEEDRGRINMIGRVSTELKLVAMRGRRLELELSRTYIAPPQILDAKAGGFAVSGLSRMQAAVSGRAAVDLGLLQPVEWRSRTDFQLDGAWFQLTERLPMRLVATGSETLVAK